MQDPLAGMEVALAGIGGAEQTAQARRGMWLHATLPRPPIGQTPHTVVHRQDKLVLRHYAPATDEGLLPVVVVPSLINRATIVDLEPDRSLVGSLARMNHPVYLVDWGVPGPEDAEEGVETVLRMLHRSVFRACHHAGAKRAILLGYCQGGTLSAIYAAVHPERVAALSVLATPIDFSKGGRFAEFANSADIDAAIGPDGLVDLDVMASAFKLLDPMGNWTKYIALEQASKNPRRLARTLARERWLEENVPLPGRFAREFVKQTYVENRLVEGTFEVGDDTVDLGRIQVPVMVNPCARDFIAPREACEPLAELVGSEAVTVEVLEAGHIGAVVGGYGPAVYYPMLDRWFRSIQS